MHSGLLTGAMNKERVANFPSGDFRRNAKNYQEPLLSRNLAVADLLAKIGARHGVSAGVVAIAWTLHHSAITAAIVGERKAGRGRSSCGDIPLFGRGVFRDPELSRPTRGLKRFNKYDNVVRPAGGRVNRNFF